jgi:Short-chain dehydrogenases of various substrate specificities
MQETILIVGATSGIGKKLCEMYAAEGHKIAATGRRLHLLEQLRSKDPEHIYIKQCDIADINAPFILSDFIKELNGIDRLILTASVVHSNPELEYIIEESMIHTNVNGFVAVINTAYNHFKQKGSGHIVAVTSIAATRGNNSTPAYNASKSFQSSYLESLRLKSLHDKNNIQITELIPGYVDTDMAKGNRLFWMANINKAAFQCKEAIDKKKSRAFITKRWRLIYWLLKFLPSFAYTSIINSKLKLQKRN